MTGKFGSRNLGESGDLSGVGTKDVKLRVLAMAEKAVADLGKVHLGQTFERDWGGSLMAGPNKDSASARFGGEVTMTFQRVEGLGKGYPSHTK
ncbi:hypothetical protein FH972_009420 [Carpinus fangiana]|uniref:Uncharacterized protein n=1 Tax=Carpinus fangiana TaxID=176857 RepID=A0A5N6R482_9ROSI|nr:hypothetical protein FH972_009420 [Carpinus fangiana]